MAKIKYGQMGVAHAHANKIKAYRESNDYEVIGVVENDPKLRQQAQRSELYRDLAFLTEEQLLNTPGLQVVGVETKIRDALPTAQKCISAGMHIHLDKPAGASLPTFRSILDEAAKKHLVVQMGYMYRYNPAIVLLRELLSKGWLGDVFEVEVDTKDGKRCAVAAKADGTEVYVECRVDPAELSEPIVKAVEALMPGGKIVEAESKKGPGIYEVSVEVESGGREYYLRVSPDGTLIQKLVRIPAIVEVPAP